ncbi:MAG: efflux RND transporter periplasmic adaptor subunit [Lysobacter sp.]
MFRTVLLLIFQVCVLAVVAGCDQPSTESAPEDPAAGVSAMAVSVARVLPQEIERTVLVSGPVSAWEEMQLGVEVSGLRVTALNVDVGEQVRKGQLLLQLDHRTLDSDLRQADAGLSEADAGVMLARSNLARGTALAGGQYISASQLDELRAVRAQAEARRNTARASRDAVALRRSFADLRAPDDGIISKRLVQPGQVVAAGTELLRLIRDGRLEWRAELTADDLVRVQPGNRILLTARDGQRVDGSVRAVSPGVDADTRTGTVYADLPAPGRLQPGTYLQGRIATGVGQVLTVPTASVVQRDGFPTVFTVDANNTAHRVRVRTGASADGRVEIAEGLKAGDAVVERGAGFLGDGDLVRIVASAPASDASSTPATAVRP